MRTAVPRGISIAIALSLGLVSGAPLFGAAIDDNVLVIHPSDPSVRSAHSYMDIQPGYDVVVASTYTNEASSSVNATFIVEVRNADGVTVLLDVFSGRVESGESIEVGAPWIPEDGGTYELRTFSVSDLEIPHVLSRVHSQTITVNDFSVTPSVQAGNETFEIPISMSYGWARIENVEMQEYWPTLRVNASTSHEKSEMIFALPIELLKRWETASQQQYCVGFPLDVIMDGQSAAASISEPTPKGQLVSVPVGKGAHQIEIVGLSLLMSPATCNSNGVITAADTSNPQITIMFPASGSTLTTGTISLMGTAQDNTGGSGVKMVQIKESGGTYKTAMPRAEGDWSTWTGSLSITSTGSHKLVARVTDNAGNYGWHIIDVATSSTGYTVTVSTEGVAIAAKDSTGKALASGSDAAAVIQAGVNAIKAKTSGGILHINAGIYLINSGISLSGTNNILIEGDDRTTTILRCGVSGGEIFFKSGATQTKNVTIRDLTIDGNNISAKLLDMSNLANLQIDNVILEQHNHPTPGVYLVNLQDSVVQNSIIRNPNNNGDAIAMTGQRVTFQYNEVTREVRGGGLTSGGLVDSKIIYNNFHDFKGYSAVSLENFNIMADGHSFKNVEIAHNTFKKLDANAISSLGYADAGSGGTYYNINIHHNQIEDAVGGIRLNAMDSQTNVMTYSSRISDNILLYTAGIAAGPLKSCDIDNNIVEHTANWRGYGIYLYKGSDNVTMDGNKISNTAKPAYYYIGSTDIYINGVNVT